MGQAGQGSVTKATQKQSRILVVDDEKVARDLLVTFLQTAGYDVLTVSTGEQALFTLREERDRIDWLFAGTKLSGLVCGWILADEFRCIHPDRPALLAGDVRFPANATDAIVFAKPVSPAEIAATLNRLRGTNEHSIDFAPPQPAPPQAVSSDSIPAFAIAS